jgi:tRNA (guanine37-N1)-methyltransferase
MPHFPVSDGRKPWRALVLTLFPEAFPGPLGVSLAAQARDAGIWSLDTIQIRNFGLGKHRQVDDTPAGGGAGMVLRADVLGPALDHAQSLSPDAPLIYLSPRGTPLTQSLARDLADGPGVTLLAGRFEGIDERVIAGKALKEISIGDYILAGGEVAAMVLIEACVRLLPGVVGASDSLTSESFETGLLEYPQFTKPRDWEGRMIPDVLLSGDHKKIEIWRREQAERLTAARRPDLLSPRAQKRR